MRHFLHLQLPRNCEERPTIEDLHGSRFIFCCYFVLNSGEICLTARINVDRGLIMSKFH